MSLLLRRHQVKWLTKGLAFTLFGLTIGCGPVGNIQSVATANSTSTPCSQGEAQIYVGDGFSRILCGCNGLGEADGTYFGGPAPLTCQLASGNRQVLFLFPGVATRHQIVPSGVNSFVPSMVMGPGSDNSFYIYVATFPQGGLTYSFVDSFNQAINGQIIVP
jgi:hypothetical protein